MALPSFTLRSKYTRFRPAWQDCCTYQWLKIQYHFISGCTGRNTLQRMQLPLSAATLSIWRAKHHFCHHERCSCKSVAVRCQRGSFIGHCRGLSGSHLVPCSSPLEGKWERGGLWDVGGPRRYKRQKSSSWKEEDVGDWSAIFVTLQRTYMYTRLLFLALQHICKATNITSVHDQRTQEHARKPGIYARVQPFLEKCNYQYCDNQHPKKLQMLYELPPESWKKIRICFYTFHEKQWVRLQETFTAH